MLARMMVWGDFVPKWKAARQVWWKARGAVVKFHEQLTVASVGLAAAQTNLNIRTPTRIAAMPRSSSGLIVSLNQ